MRIPVLFTAMAGLFLVHIATADIGVRVGGGAGCNYNNIQAAINSALPVNGITNIMIARDQAYNAQQLDIDGKNVRLLGGYANCQQTTRDSTKTVLNGSGGAARSILNIRGSTVVVGIYLLDFQSGDELTDTSSYGGAIDITQGPHALIYLEENRFFNNRAGIGGAISIRNGTASQGGVYVQMASRNIVLQNAGLHGAGGIFCRGASLDIKGVNNFIFQNTAGDATVMPNVVGYGGGLIADDCLVNIGGQGVVFDGNNANGAGGGIFANGSQSVMHLYNINPGNPQILSNNTANTFGGGIDIEQGARVYAWDMIIRNNIARGGGGAVALYDDGATDFSTFVASRYFTAATPNGDTATFSKAFNCTQPEVCNRIENNLAEAAGGTLKPGGAIRLSGDDSGVSDAELIGTRVIRNRGSSTMEVKYFSNSFPRLTLNGAVVDQNIAEENLIYAESNTRVDITNSTIAENTIGASRIISRAASSCPINAAFPSIRVHGSIVWQPGKTLTPGVGQAGCVRYNTLSNLDNVPSVDQQYISVGNPLFVDPANGNFRLQAASPALDYGPAAVSAVTSDGGVRVIDLPYVTNAWGPQDSGAYERLLDSDVIFANGFDAN